MFLAALCLYLKIFVESCKGANGPLLGRESNYASRFLKFNGKFIEVVSLHPANNGFIFIAPGDFRYGFQKIPELCIHSRANQQEAINLFIAQQGI